MLKSFVLGFALWLVAGASSHAVGADTRLGDSCDLVALGAADKQEFLHFDHDLRAALGEQNANALVSLVRFPLRVNYHDGSHVSLDNPAALQKQFAHAFPAELRGIVQNQSIGALFCKSDGGVMYGNGEVWADLIGKSGAQRFRITAVNVPESQAAAAAEPSAPQAPDNKVRLTCSSEKFHIVIDSGSGDAVRYRAWNNPHVAPAKPDMDLPGTQGGEGTGSCFHRMWTFKNGDVDYIVSEPGCSEHAPPAHAVGQVEVRINGKMQLTSWCF